MRTLSAVSTTQSCVLICVHLQNKGDLAEQDSQLGHNVVCCSERLHCVAIATSMQLKYVKVYGEHSYNTPKGVHVRTHVEVLNDTVHTHILYMQRDTCIVIYIHAQRDTCIVHAYKGIRV